MVSVEERIDEAVHSGQLPASVIGLLKEAAEEIAHLRKQLASK
jgi:hypothetical protein